MKLTILFFVLISWSTFGQSLIVSSNNGHTYEGIEPLPFNYGGNGRYIYVLNSNNYTTASPTTQYVKVMDTGASDAVIATITLTASKRFASIHYRSVDQCVYVLGLNWYDKIDADPASGTFNTILTSSAITNGSMAYIIGSYLPYPFDFFTSGGTHMAVPGGAEFPLYNSTHSGYDFSGETSNAIRLGGHSNASNIIYYHISQVIQSNKIQIKVTNQQSTTMPNVTYSFQADPQSGWYNDLQAQNFPVIRFRDFIPVSTDGVAYALMTDAIGSPLIFPFFNMTVSNRTYHTYCPNAHDKLFFTSQITDNKIQVVEIDSVNKRYNSLGTIDRAAYKDTNESGANQMLYSPYSGRLYVMANNNSNLTGVSLIHIYDPTQSVASMYVRSISVGELKSEYRVSVFAQNTMCMNRTPIYEYRQKGLTAP